jgi:hypothetical protein
VKLQELGKLMGLSRFITLQNLVGYTLNSLYREGFIGFGI